jgi:Spy/CpxP family protein refolding chaperone
MKTKILVAWMAVTAAVQLGPVLYGQESGPHGQARRHRTERLANLPPEERQKLKAAHEKAMQDPGLKAAQDKLRQARKEFRDSMRAAMLKADPTIQPILDKMPKGEKEWD